MYLFLGKGHCAPRPHFQFLLPHSTVDELDQGIILQSLFTRISSTPAGPNCQCLVLVEPRDSTNTCVRQTIVRSDNRTDDKHLCDVIHGRDLRQGLPVNLILDKRFVGLCDALAVRRLFDAVSLSGFSLPFGDRRKRKRHLRATEQEDVVDTPRCDTYPKAISKSSSCPPTRTPPSRAKSVRKKSLLTGSRSAAPPSHPPAPLCGSPRTSPHTPHGHKPARVSLHDVVLIVERQEDHVITTIRRQRLQKLPLRRFLGDQREGARNGGFVTVWEGRRC